VDRPPAGLRQVRLPNNLAIWTSSRFDAMLLYRELVEDRPYEKHGISLHAGTTVFDVGANVGLFAITAAATVPDLRIHCFEPVPLLFAALQRNLAEHVPTAVAHRVALARTPGQGSITFDPHSTVTGSLYPEVFREAADPAASMLVWARAAAADFERVNAGPLPRALRAGLANRASAPVALAAMLPLWGFLEARRRLFTRREACTLERLSNVLRSLGRPAVDLLKVDVEGAEEDVLLGVDAGDWPVIRQIVVEVHDVDGRLDRLTRLLEANGYRTSRDREPWALHAVMNISTLYAVRP
jgi:hypothetical protein